LTHGLNSQTGVPEELGIIPCAVDGVFDAINEVSHTDRSKSDMKEPDRAYLLRVSYIEIYNETLRDLLNLKKGPLRDDEKPTIHTGKVGAE
jgi:centromeric protein E